MNSEIFQNVNGEVVQTGRNWIYIWKGSDHRILKVGATWLHPAARAEKHLMQQSVSSATVIAYEVPQGLDRGVIKRRLACRLSEAQLLSDAVDGAEIDRTSSALSSEEESFVGDILAELVK